ncbi:MAG: SMC-Scp complex subunit ScpB [Nanobdellota archaeon]
MKTNNDFKNRIEAILYASGKGVNAEDLATYTSESKRKVNTALKKLREEYENRDSSLIVREHNGKWKLTVRGKYTEDVKNIVSETELAIAILKTLAVIAYKSPVLQSDIIDMRGQGAYDHIKELVKEKFVTKEKEGRSYLLKITEKFYDYFDVEGDEEIREVFDKLREEQASQQKLEVVEIDEKKQEETPNENDSQQKLGGLEIVDTTDDKSEENENQDPEKILRQKEEEEKVKKEQEKTFLNDIDSRINSLSQRVQEHNIPSAKEKNDTEQQESEKTKDQDEKEELERNIEEESPQNENDNSSQGNKPINTIEEFVANEEEKEKNRPHYL